MKDLVKKYNKPVPRYTSYPTVPNWDLESFETSKYLDRLDEAAASGAGRRGIAVYIHLPYCESLCTYCGCNTRITVNHKVEGPYIDAVTAEWRMYLERLGEKPLIREIHLGGGTPTFFSPEQLTRLISNVTDDCEVSEAASFSFEAHPANTTRAHLLALRKAGFDRLSLGVQDFDEKVQKAINRWQTPEDVHRVTEEARSLGFRSVNFDLVYGLPFQSATGFRQTVEEVMRMRPDRIALYSYAHVPWKHPGQRAYSENDLPDADAKLALFTAGRDAFRKAGYVSIGLDHFSLPADSLTEAYGKGKVHRNFMGYTDLKTDLLIGLGVSAISDLGTAYGQNAKSVEGYLEKINGGKCPVVKGHLSDATDIILGKHILNLMCRHETDWESETPEVRAFMDAAAENFSCFVQDGLAVLTGQNGRTLKITEKGRIFVRNIAEVIDKYRRPVEEKNQFASAI